MKEKYEKLKKDIINYDRGCIHDWEEPIYDPDIFDGDMRWKYVCKNCGKIVYTFDKVNVNTLKMKSKGSKNN